VGGQIGLGAGLVPPGSLSLREPVLGFDPSTRRIAGAAVGLPVPTWRMLSLEQGQPAARLRAAMRDLMPWLRDWRTAEGFQRPGLVVIEQPFASGRYVPHESLHMIGVLQAALWDVLAPVEIVFLGPAEWKSRALGAGHGAAKKPEILRWAREVCGLEAECMFCENGLDPLGEEEAKKRKAWKAGDCRGPTPAHDLADALGIATAGGVLLEQRRAA
jgi:hypothetical protein